MEKKMEYGIYTLGDLVADPHSGKIVSPAVRIKEIIHQAILAEKGGLDIFGVGEHHRLDYAVSAPALVLASIAQATEKIRLTSAATVLSTTDPVRLFEDFSTLDLLSGGRAEIMCGRGAFAESFSLFGYELEENDALFKEKMALLLKLNEEKIISWHGRFRPELQQAEISPRPLQEQLPIWIGVGGSPESAAFAGKSGANMAMAILKGDALRFKPLADAYWEAARNAGQPIDQLSLGVTGHAFIAQTTKEAKEQFYLYYKNYRSYVHRQRGEDFQLTWEEFEELTAPDTSLFVGSPESVAQKIANQYQLFGHNRFIAQMDIGGLPAALVEQSIRLFAEVTVPLANELINNVK
ncbi:LLM class flavin-dependent oxidoreductase [Aciduricibacillus chroicocephali]|uniref:LLM class flavin-dependent oxidoreductase n=1 Tax=Aciduricibacillus chroicocephali TaxID=3054939 RepID=A0ABY9KT17_9BACI|nr:LLM class flavin-dependent oxidoreductase [Bacillaceae bacterium 44XB]